MVFACLAGGVVLALQVVQDLRPGASRNGVFGESHGGYRVMDISFLIGIPTGV